MTNMKRLRLRARSALHKHQAKRLIARANRLLVESRLKQRPLPTLSNNAGFDELRSPVFLSVMAAAVIVLFLDLGGYLPQVFGHAVGA
jgi:hypothetical protein